MNTKISNGEGGQLEFKGKPGKIDAIEKSLKTRRRETKSKSTRIATVAKTGRQTKSRWRQRDNGLQLFILKN